VAGILNGTYTDHMNFAYSFCSKDYVRHG
jgi:hypothetical protein